MHRGKIFRAFLSPALFCLASVLLLLSGAAGVRAAEATADLGPLILKFTLTQDESLVTECCGGSILFDKGSGDLGEPDFRCNTTSVLAVCIPFITGPADFTVTSVIRGTDAFSPPADVSVKSLLSFYNLELVNNGQANADVTFDWLANYVLTASGEFAKSEITVDVFENIDNMLVNILPLFDDAMPTPPPLAVAMGQFNITLPPGSLVDLQVNQITFAETAIPEAIPEPSSLSLFYASGLGLLLTWYWRRRRYQDCGDQFRDHPFYRSEGIHPSLGSNAFGAARSGRFKVG